MFATLLDTPAVHYQVEHAGAMGKKNNKKKKQEKEAKKAEEEEAEFDRMLKEVKQDDPDQGPQAVEPPPAEVCTRGLVSASA